jgi:hypothetical protein
MAQTPKSASVTFSSTTPTTIYTVPGGATAVVKSVIPTSVIGSSASVTLNKVSSSGTVYPLAVNAATEYSNATSTYYYVNAIPNLNLLPAPITLSAGESISISTSTGTYFKDPISVSNSNYKLYGANYVNGNYVVLGQDTSTGLGLVLTSTDGTTWTQRTFNFYTINQDITFGNGYYVICNQSSSGKIHYSTDLATWTEVSLPSPYAMYTILFANNKFVVGGQSGFAFTATSTPVTWTAITFPNGGNTSDINSINYVGTNYVFGTTNATFTSTDLTTFATPSYAYDYSSVSPSNVAANATTLFQSMNNTISTDPTRVLQTTTSGQTWTNVTSISATNGSTFSSSYVTTYGNGALVLSQGYWGGSTIRYSYSADGGTTWTNATGLAITNYTQNGAPYNQSVYPIIDTARNWMFSNVNGYLQFNAVASSGVITATASWNFASSVFYGPYSVSGNPTTGTWVAATASYVISNSQYWGWHYGSSPTNGVDGNNTGAVVYRPSYGYCNTTLHRPGSSGFLFGTSTGYIMYNSSYTDTALQGNVRPTAVNSPVCAFACDGNTSTSTIVYIQGNGQGAVSRDQGVTWTTMRLPGSSFGTQADYAGRCLQYVNGVWIAVNTSGQSFYSTTGLTWSTAPVGVTNTATMNSNNVFLTPDGIFSSSGTSVTSFTRTTTSSYANYPSSRNMVYAGSKYLIGQLSSIVQSTDLITWSSASVSSTAINDVVYWTTANGTVLLQDGSGNILPVGAKRSSPTAEGKIGKSIAIANALVVGNATAGIVEIT